MSAAVQCDACGKYVKPGGAYRILIMDYLSSRTHCSGDLCAACRDRITAQARGLQEASE